MTFGISPRVQEAVGETVSILGVKAVVTDVVPETDYHWRVYLTSESASGGEELWEIVIPTDYHTSTGVLYCL